MRRCRMYWADETRFWPILDGMPRNMIGTVTNYFHTDENSTLKAGDYLDYDKLFKVKPFKDRTKSSFKGCEVEA